MKRKESEQTNINEWNDTHGKCIAIEKIERNGNIIEIKCSDGRMKMRRFFLLGTSAIDIESILSI